MEQVTKVYECRVLWCEGRPCLEYSNEEELRRIEAYIRATFEKELLDVFFTKVESLPEE